MFHNNWCKDDSASFSRFLRDVASAWSGPIQQCHLPDILIIAYWFHCVNLTTICTVSGGFSRGFFSYNYSSSVPRPNLFIRIIALKGSGWWEQRRVRKVANTRNSSQMVVTDVIFFFDLASIMIKTSITRVPSIFRSLSIFATHVISHWSLLFNKIPDPSRDRTSWYIYSGRYRTSTFYRHFTVQLLKREVVLWAL
jgi:hypothetical protein